MKIFGHHFFAATHTLPETVDEIQIGPHRVPIVFRRHTRARNYILRLLPNHTVSVTVPNRGSLEYAREFVASRMAWLEKQWTKLAARPIKPGILRPGAEILFRGIPTRLDLIQHEAQWSLQLGEIQISVTAPEDDLRPILESKLRALAEAELPARLQELITLYKAPVKRITIRNQKSRWGSCSRKGTISLNWRLIQTPPFVMDYILIHELTHLKVMNHSPAFWAEVAKLRPDYQQAEIWLRQHSKNIVF